MEKFCFQFCFVLKYLFQPFTPKSCCCESSLKISETIRSDVEIGLPRQHVRKCNISGSKKRGNSRKTHKCRILSRKMNHLRHLRRSVFSKSCQIIAKIICDSSSELPPNKLASFRCKSWLFEHVWVLSAFHSFWKFVENLVLTALFVNLFDFPLHILLLPFAM